MKSLIQQLVQSPPLYGRFLNTLSLLEYIGARKILKSQHQDTVNEKILRHAAEEIRHAQVLKRAALKHAPLICKTYAPAALLCGEQAHRYFQTIDHAAHNYLGERDSWAAYLYTTYLAEIRATSFYTFFEETLQELGEASIFRGILVEEERHLRDILDYLECMPNSAEKMAILKNIEDQEFSKFIESINTTLTHEQLRLV